MFQVNQRVFVRMPEPGVFLEMFVREVKEKTVVGAVVGDNGEDLAILEYSSELVVVEPWK